MDKGMKKDGFHFMLKIRSACSSKISGLFSGNLIILDSLTVGTTEDPTVSCMTIATVSDDETLEQIKNSSTG